MTDIHKRLIDAGIPQGEIDHHSSDLYVKKTPTSTAIINEYEFKCNVTTFIDQITKTVWYEIPFAYNKEEK
jgi:hypothetical protein